jgi:hypothetical protein
VFEQQLFERETLPATMQSLFVDAMLGDGSLLKELRRNCFAD